MARKSEVYTWRVSPSMKASLEEAARNTNRTVAQLLDDIVAAHLSSTSEGDESETAHQRRLHARAARFLGCFAGDPGRRGVRARELIRARLMRRRRHER
jgi:hypothetical protein